MKRIRILALIASLTAAGCVTNPTGDVLLGVWGGSHLRMEVTAAGAHLEYDCATGIIEEPLRPDKAGRFTVVGSHTPGHGGPIRIDEKAPAFRARYEGLVDGEHMELRVTLTDTGMLLGTFQLRRGSAGFVFRCL